MGYRSGGVDSTLGFVAAGVVFGLGAGFAPGPLLALVLAESMRHGTAGGLQVAVSPLVTDPPIILLALLLFTRIAEPGPIVGVVSLAGGGVLLYLAAGTLAPLPAPAVGGPAALGPRRFGSFARGVAANLVNPHPYLFWLVVGAPTLVQARAASGFAAVGFVAGMYSCLVGAKVLTALAAGRGRVRLDSRYYALALRLLAAALALLGVRSLWDGLQYLGGSV